MSLFFDVINMLNREGKAFKTNDNCDKPKKIFSRINFVDDSLGELDK